MAFLLPALAAGAGAAAVPLGEAIGGAASGGIKKLRDWLHFSKGGIVPGRAGQRVPAILHAGEMIIPRATVATLMRRGGQAGRRAPAKRKAPARKAPAKRKAAARRR